MSLTNIASNTATANVLVPILAEMALTMCINPIYLTLPAGKLQGRLIILVSFSFYLAFIALKRLKMVVSSYKYTTGSKNELHKLYHDQILITFKHIKFQIIIQIG